MPKTYEEECRAATAEQGLDPIIAALGAANLKCHVEQTGGYCMVVTVLRGSAIFGITPSEVGSADRPWLLVYYPTTEDWESGDGGTIILSEDDDEYLTTEEVIASLNDARG